MFLDTDVGKDGLDNAQASGIDFLTLRGVDLGFHLIDHVGRLLIGSDGKIPARRVWFAQTPGFQGAGSALFFAGVVNIISAIAVALVASVAGQLIPLRANVDLVGCIQREICSGEGGRFGGLWLPGLDAVLETLLVSETRVSFAELDIRDISIDGFGLAQGESLEGMIIAVSGELLPVEVGSSFADGDDVLFCTLEHGSQVFMILGTEGFGGKDDLVLGIDPGLGVVALDDAMRRGHFDGLVVDDIALDLIALAAEFGFLFFKELVQAFDLELEAFFAFLLALKVEFGLAV